MKGYNTQPAFLVISLLDICLFHALTLVRLQLRKWH